MFGLESRDPVPKVLRIRHLFGLLTGILGPRALLGPVYVLHLQLGPLPPAPF